MFEVGKEYRRRTEIHEIYGGQRQGGISTPANHPHIFLFTSQAGIDHGYWDEFKDDGQFWYTGEGQIGDMKMVSGNQAIHTHLEKNKQIFLFEQTRKAYVRFIGTACYTGHHIETRPDREGSMRSAFVFHLDVDSINNVNENRVFEEAITYVTKNNKMSLAELRKVALSKPETILAPKARIQLARVRSIALKRYILGRANGICEGCATVAPFKTKRGPYLECHHIHRLSDGGPDDPANVVALCPNCHKRAHFSLDATRFNCELAKTTIFEIQAQQPVVTVIKINT